MSTLLAQHYENKPKELADLLALMPQKRKVNDAQPKPTSAAQNISALSWDALDRRGLLQKLRAENAEAYRQKYKEKFGVLPNID